MFGQFMKERKKKKMKNKNMNDRLIKDITIREIKALFEQQEKEENYYEPKRVSNF